VYNEQAVMDRSRLTRFLNSPLSELRLEEPVILPGTSPARRALELMREGSRSCVLTTSGDGLAGIFTERDVLLKCMADGFDWDQPLDGLATRSPATISSGATVAEAIAALHQHGYRTFPVMDGQQVVGLVRTGDLLTHIAEAFPEDVLNLPPRLHQVMEKEEGG
jgi:CBS domain-containing protein